MADISWSLYPFDPVKPLPIIFATIISGLGLLNIYQNFFKYRWWHFGFILTWASLVWSAGFICRVLSEYHHQNIGLFIAQYVLILVGPPLYGASETFILGRLMAYMPYYAPMHPGRVMSTFLILSAVIEAVTANGASRTGSAPLGPEGDSQRKSGTITLCVGLILQCFLEILFLTLTYTLHSKARKGHTLPRQVKIMLYVLYLTSSMILVRCVIRVAEGFESLGCPPGALFVGHCDYISSHEAFLWVFEVANITLFVIILTIFSPGRFLPQSHKVFLDRIDGKTERLGPGFSNIDKRPWLVTVADPFNLGAIIGGKGAEIKPFWDDHQPVYVGQEHRDYRKGGKQEATSAAEPELESQPDAK